MSSLRESYDYVVCGGGSAGCVVASRLSEDPNCSVLLLEAGPSDLDWPDTEIPAMCGSLQRTEIDWDYKVSFIRQLLYRILISFSHTILSHK